MESEEAILYQVDDLIRQCEYNAAYDLLSSSIKKFYNKTSFIDRLASVNIECGDIPAAKELLLHSISLEPNKDPEKYFSLGQINEGISSLNYYNQGIKICKNLLTIESDDNRKILYRTHIATVYCAIAELYMTDLCDEKNAEKEIEKVLSDASKIIQPDLTNTEANVEIMVTLAQFRLIQDRITEAIDAANSAFMIIITLSESDSFALRLKLLKVFLELNLADPAVLLGERLILDNDSEPELWYLLAVAHYHSDETDTALEYISQGLEKFKNTASSDIISLMEDLFKSISEKKVNNKNEIEMT